jgi:hypothetical protein
MHQVRTTGIAAEEEKCIALNYTLLASLDTIAATGRVREDDK